jgi:small subunit ribosomal protein S20
MPHPPSAKKRHRQSLRRGARNQPVRTAARSAVRRARELIAAGSDEAQEAVRQATSVLDRAARKGILHPNNASRRKSRLMRRLGSGAPVAQKKRRTATRTRKAPTRSKKS